MYRNWHRVRTLCAHPIESARRIRRVEDRAIGSPRRTSEGLVEGRHGDRLRAIQPDFPKRPVCREPDPATIRREEDRPYCTGRSGNGLRVQLIEPLLNTDV